MKLNQRNQRIFLFVMGSKESLTREQYIPPTDEYGSHK